MIYLMRYITFCLSSQQQSYMSHCLNFCSCVLVNCKEGNAFVFFWYIELHGPYIYLKMTNYSNFCHNWIHAYDFMQTIHP